VDISKLGLTELLGVTFADSRAKRNGQYYTDEMPTQHLLPATMTATFLEKCSHSNKILLPRIGLAK